MKILGRWAGVLVLLAGLLLFGVSFGYQVLSVGDFIPPQDPPPHVEQEYTRKALETARTIAALNNLALRVTLSGAVLTTIQFLFHRLRRPRATRTE